MSRYWSELVSRLTPYVPGEQPRGEHLIKLNTNESPYPPASAVLQAIAQVRGDDLRLYPDPQSTALRRAVAGRCGLSMEQVFAGNGSDEILAFAFMALLKQELPLYFPDITYSFYPVWCELCGIDFREIPVAEDFSIDPLGFPARNGGIVVANPNAPTGRPMPLSDIRRLLRHSPDSVVVIDEAYIDFGGESAVALLGQFDNLLVVQTLSKSRALAGLRVGLAMGHPDLIEALDRVKNSFNSYPLDGIAQRAAEAALQSEDYTREICARVAHSRDRLAASLSRLDFDVLPSAANFLFVTHPAHTAVSLFNGLREGGILVRHFDRPRIDNYLRISIGTDEECDALVARLEDLLGN